jgi:hypothetical protein
MRRHLPRLSSLVALVLIVPFVACKAMGGGGLVAESGCDPLTPKPITLGAIVGVGQDAAGTLYVDSANGTYSIIAENGPPPKSGLTASPPPTAPIRLRLRKDVQRHRFGSDPTSTPARVPPHDRARSAQGGAQGDGVGGELGSPLPIAQRVEPPLIPLRPRPRPGDRQRGSRHSRPPSSSRPFGTAPRA